MIKKHGDIKTKLPGYFLVNKVSEILKHLNNLKNPEEH